MTSSPNFGAGRRGLFAICAIALGAAAFALVLFILLVMILRAGAGIW